MAKCKLCLEDRKLIKSHIIPKFMFKKMKDENNVFYEVTINIGNGDFKQRKTQIEDYDNNILCENCDNKILGGIYERYAEKVLYGKDLPENISPKCTNFINPTDNSEFSICTNIDYQKLKIFFLSILWRSSITDRSYFQDVSLGQKHEERIREIILNNEYINFDEYPIVITSFMRTENTLENLIAPPKRIKNKSGLNGYVFLIDSMQIIIYVNSKNHKLSSLIEKLSLKDNELITSHLPNGKELEFMKMLMNK